MRQHGVGDRLLRPGARELRIERRSPAVEQRDRARQAVAEAPVDQRLRFDEQRVGLRAVGGLGDQRSLAARQHHLQLRGDVARAAVLQVEHVGEVAVVVLATTAATPSRCGPATR